MTAMTDIHCHLLPGLDDGAESMEETIEALKSAADQGINRMIMTPHYHPGRYKVPAKKVLESLEQVKEECQRRKIPMELYPGQECLYYTGLPNLLEKGEVLPLAGSNCLLVEFETDCSFRELTEGLHKVRCSGYQPVLAHLERYECLRKRSNVEELKKREYLLQINGSTLLRKNTLFHKSPWKELVQDGLVDFLGSDCHGMHFRPLQMMAVQQWMEQHVDVKIRENILWKNAEKYLFLTKHDEENDTY